LKVGLFCGGGDCEGLAILDLVGRVRRGWFLEDWKANGGLERSRRAKTPLLMRISLNKRAECCGRS
jgi:hypothetical protein